MYQEKEMHEHLFSYVSHKFSGVIYSYGRISVPEPTSDGFAQLSFDYNIEDNNNIPRDEFNEEFFTLIGDILVDITDQKLGKKRHDF